MPYKDANRRRNYNREYHGKWYSANKSKRKQQVNNRRRELKQKFRNYKETLNCEVCGISGEGQHWILEFNHKDQNEKVASVSALVSGGYAWSRVMEEINKCEVLCANCHRKQHYDAYHANPLDNPTVNNIDNDRYQNNEGGGKSRMQKRHRQERANLRKHAEQNLPKGHKLSGPKEYE